MLQWAFLIVLPVILFLLELWCTSFQKPFAGVPKEEVSECQSNLSPSHLEINLRPNIEEIKIRIQFLLYQINFVLPSFCQFSFLKVLWQSKACLIQRLYITLNVSHCFSLIFLKNLPYVYCIHGITVSNLTASSKLFFRERPVTMWLFSSPRVTVEVFGFFKFACSFLTGIRGHTHSNKGGYTLFLLHCIINKHGFLWVHMLLTSTCSPFYSYPLLTPFNFTQKFIQCTFHFVNLF